MLKTALPKCSVLFGALMGNITFTYIKDTESFNQLICSFIFTLADESKGSNTSVAFLTVLRMMGRFGSASVEWFVVDQKSNADLSPLNGSLSFGHGIGERTIHIRALPDEVGNHIVSI